MTLRLILFDRTCGGPGMLPGLTDAWRTGSLVYRMLGRVDRAVGVASWDEAAQVVASTQPEEPLEEIQYWGHGRFGRVMIDREALDESGLREETLSPFVAALRERFATARIAGCRPLLWLRTCEAFGGHVGHAFARALTERLEARAAGHTFIIGFWQSGLHCLAPGETPRWDASEGIARGTAERPELGAWSTPNAPRTIHCLEGSIPPAWWDAH